MKLLARTLTAEDIVNGDRTETTTRQVRRRTRSGANGEDVVEEEQEVIVRTTVIRYVGAGLRSETSGENAAKGEEQGEQEEHLGEAEMAHDKPNSSLHADVSKAEDEEMMQVDM